MRTIRGVLVFSLIMLLWISGCGTRDYSSENDEEKQEQQTNQGEGRGSEENSEESTPMTAQRQTARPSGQTQSGYLWDGMEWIGLPDSRVEQFKSYLADQPDTNDFKALGTNVIGGGLLGLVVRASGSWFFGKPVESNAGHRFWSGVDKARKASGQGFLRGGVFSGACYLALTGVNPLSVPGLLGADFKALSSALVLGGMAGGAAGVNAKNMGQWTSDSVLVKGFRYKIGRSVAIIGIGTGVGVLVYNWIQEPVPGNLPKKRENKVPPPGRKQQKDKADKNAAQQQYRTL